MLRHRPSLLIRPELDDGLLHATLAELRPSPQLHGLGAGSSRPVREPAARLLRATGRDWDRRAHRVSVLARNMPSAIPERWVAERPAHGDALLLSARAAVARIPVGDPAAVRQAEQACLRAADPAPGIRLPGRPCSR